MRTACHAGGQAFDDAASNGASRSRAWHVRALEVLSVYLRRHDEGVGSGGRPEIEAKSSQGRGHRSETCHAQHKQPRQPSVRLSSSG